MRKYLLLTVLSGLSLAAHLSAQQQYPIAVSGSLSVPVSGATTTQNALISPADRTAFAAKQNAIPYTTENAAKKNAANGYMGADANGLLPWVKLSGVPTFQAPLGFVPENPNNRDKPSGYPSLDAAGLLPWVKISGVPVASATVFGCLNPSDFILFSQKQAALGYVPENPANKNIPNGYMGADATGQLPWNRISGVKAASPNQTGVLTAANWISFNAREKTENKGKANGYPGLDANGRVPASQLPAPPTALSQFTNDAGFIKKADVPVRATDVFNEVYQGGLASLMLANSNVVASTVRVYLNRSRLAPCPSLLACDFTVSGNVVAFAIVPNASDSIVVDYQFIK